MFPTYYCNKTQTEFSEAKGKLISNESEINIKDGIPRFVENNNYASAFGEQWKKYKKTQLDSYTKVPITYERIKRCCGEELFNNLSGKIVLEAGCGAGRFTEVLLEQGCKLASFDLSDAVEANADNFPISDRHLLFQADIYDIPFKPQQFDVVICLGVIQHTPSPEKTIAKLYEQVKPGGWLVIDHYTHKLSHYTKLTEVFRFFIKRLKPKSGIKVTDTITDLFFPLHKAVRKVYPLQALLSRVSPVHSYYFAYPQLSHEDQYQWARLDTHDTLTDWYKHLRSKGSIRKTLSGLKPENIYCEYSPHGIDARCQKPK